MKMIQRYTMLSLVPEGENLFHELASHISIADEAGGEFVIVRQEDGHLKIDPEEWPQLREAIDVMIRDCKS